MGKAGGGAGGIDRAISDMKRTLGWILAAVVAIAGLVVAWTVLLGSFTHFGEVERKFAGSCSPVTGIAGPEDLQIDPATRLAFISSHDRRAAGSGERGAIYAISLDDPLDTDGWRDRTKGAPERFEPMGLHLYHDGEVRRLFVVNAATSAVELFDVARNGDLTHMESFSERRLTSPNNVVGVGPRAFYVSNDVEAGRDSLMGRLHFLMRAASGRVMYFDGLSWRIAAEGLRFANGVAVSPDGERLYVAETSSATLRIYARDVATGALDWRRTESMPAAVDNINVDQGGVLWIGAHARPLALTRYRREETGRLPSLVIRYDPTGEGRVGAVPVYADDGVEISAASAAARLGSTLLIGALLEKKFLICDLP